MEFGSIEEMIAYVKRQVISTNDDLGEEMVRIAKEETKKQQDSYSPSQYDRTGALVNCIGITNINPNGVEISWQDNGGWTSVKGSPFYAPQGLENGTTWGRPGTDFVDQSFNEIEDKIPMSFKRHMRSRGVPIE
ncbi:hypothetical protein UT300012_32200 [Paraclostridium bifermentans]